MFFGENIDVQVCIFKEIIICLYENTEVCSQQDAFLQHQFALGINKVQNGYFGTKITVKVTRSLDWCHLKRLPNNKSSLQFSKYQQLIEIKNYSHISKFKVIHKEGVKTFCSIYILSKRQYDVRNYYCTMYEIRFVYM